MYNLYKFINNVKQCLFLKMPSKILKLGNKCNIIWHQKNWTLIIKIHFNYEIFI